MSIIFQHTGHPMRMTEFSLDGYTLSGSSASTRIQQVKVLNPEKVSTLIEKADPKSEDDREKLAAYFY